MVLSQDSYVIKTWGCNNEGQLGTGSMNSVNYPIDLLISDIPKSPKAYLRISSISCGSNFAAACVLPSRGRLFVWGAFQVSDVENKVTSGFEEKTSSSSGSPWATSMSTKPPPLLSHLSKPGGVNLRHLLSAAKTSGCVKAILAPTATSHRLWKDRSVIKATCGHTSNVSVSSTWGIIRCGNGIHPPCVEGSTLLSHRGW